MLPFQPTPQKNHAHNSNKPQSNQSHNNPLQTNSKQPQLMKTSHTKQSPQDSKKTSPISYGHMKISYVNQNSSSSDDNSPNTNHYSFTKNHSPPKLSEIDRVIDEFSYKNGFIYSPNVPVIAEITASIPNSSSKKPKCELRMFEKSEVFLVDFISISPVNKTQITENLKNHHHIDDDDDDILNKKINDVMKNKIKSVLTFAAGKEDYLILGAFGCGNFGNDPNDVVKLFVEVLFKEKYAYYFKRIYFAMGRNDSTYDVFKNALKKFMKSEEKTKHQKRHDNEYDEYSNNDDDDED